MLEKYCANKLSGYVIGIVSNFPSVYGIDFSQLIVILLATIFINRSEHASQQNLL